MGGGGCDGMDVVGVLDGGDGLVGWVAGWVVGGWVDGMDGWWGWVDGGGWIEVSMQFCLGVIPQIVTG